MRRPARGHLRRGTGSVRIAIEGPSGAGKTTISRSLARRLKARWIREAYDRISPRPSLGVASPKDLLRVEQRLLSEETRRHVEAKHEGRTRGTVILDTGFLGPATYSAGLADRSERFRPAAGRILRSTIALVRAGRLGLPELTIYLDVGARELDRRNRKAVRSHPTRYQQRHRQVARSERRFWKEVGRVHDPRAVWFVRATARPASIVDRLERRISRWSPVPSPRGLAWTALRSLEATRNP